MRFDTAAGAEEPDEESLIQVAKRVGRNRQTIWRWVTYGVAVGSNVVKLQARRIGGRWVVTREAWEQFVRETNPQAPVLPESPAAERRRFEQEQEVVMRRLGSTEEEIRAMKARRQRK